MRYSTTGLATASFTFTAWILGTTQVLAQGGQVPAGAAPASLIDLSDSYIESVDSGWRGDDTLARLKKTRACVECNFIGTSLRNLDLSGVDLRRAKMMMVDLKGAKLRG